MKSSIYFITDCHFSEKYDIDKNKIDSLGQIIKIDSNPFIYLAISGDIAFSGRASEYKLFCNFFDDIKKISKKDIKLIVCPGNHDINFNNEEYSLKSLINDTAKENVGAAFENRKSKIASYQSFERMNSNLKYIDDFLSFLSFNKDEKEIIFYSLNNVLFSCFGSENSSDDTRNYAYLSEQTIRNIKRKNPNQIVFLLMHFPITYFNDKIGKILKERIIKNVDVILNGHLHVSEKKMIVDKSNVAIIQGDYFSVNNGDDNGSFVKIDLSKNEYVEFKWENESYIEQDDIVKLDLKASRWNSLNVSFNNDFYLELTQCDILDKKFNINDIFVFPYLCSEKYEDFDDNEVIKDFSSFLLKTKNNRFIYIYGYEGSGKTSLSKYLTLLFFNENYFPVLCDGDQFSKVKDFDKHIRNRIREMYSDSTISKFENEILFSNKVLIIDDYSSYNNEFLSKASEVFKSIIVVFKLDKNKLLNKPISINETKVLEYTIQPMVKSKRKEFTYKIYDALTSLGEKSNLTKENFFLFVEKQLNTLAINDICDPISLAYLEINSFHLSDAFDNTLFSNVNQAKSLLMLDNVIKRKKYNCNIDSINRMMSYIAYDMYKNNKQDFSIEDISKAFEYETDNYGDPEIKQYDISQLMLDTLIAKELDNRNLTFFNRDIFSYYIALYINIQIGEGDNSLFIDLLSKDIFVPLNFNILMCLASIYKNITIPNTIIDLISTQIKDMPLLDEKNFSISGITKEKQEELKRLTREDIIKINEKQDEYERQQHDAYLKNKDNLYYVEAVPHRVKEIYTLFDKLKICCVLLKKLNTSIKKAYKEKLINLIVSLPNIILYQFNDYLFKELDNLYAALKEYLTNKPSSSVISDFNNFVISTKRAFILSTYDYGSRCIADKTSKDLLKKFIEDSNSELKIVQNLMFKSFFIDEDSFIKFCSSLINDKKYKENSFVKASAKLIGRRYIVDNYETCVKKYRDFVGLVFNSPKEALRHTIKNKIKK